MTITWTDKANAERIISDQEFAQLNDEYAKLLVADVPSFDSCTVCKMEAYAVKRDPRYTGAGWCTGTFDGHHQWPIR